MLCILVIAAGWNILDFIVVIFGFLELSSSFGNYTFLRSFRVLRPLRAITKIAALKVIDLIKYMSQEAGQPFQKTGSHIS